LAPVLACIAQAELGDYHVNGGTTLPTDHNTYNRFLDQHEQMEPSFWDAVAEAHEKLMGWSKTKAEYWLLKEASAMKCYGEEVFIAKMVAGETVLLGIGPDGVNIYNPESRDLIQSINYQCIHVATHTGKCLFLTFFADSSEVVPQTLEFKFDGSKSANSIYRAITEKHAFYSCETVRRSVTTQFIRDLKGTIVSLFNENTAMGKNYVFDVRLTCREVYDNARRTLYLAKRRDGGNQSERMEAEEDGGSDESCGSILKRRKSLSFTDEEDADDLDLCCMEFDCDESEQVCKRQSCAAVQERLASFEDALLCRICMDADINTAFFPCRHVACCNSCAILCDRCPLCRSSIECSQFIYLPFQATKADA